VGVIQPLTFEPFWINPDEKLIIAMHSAWPAAWDDKHEAQRNAFLDGVNKFLR
jgi:hypothetical protein